MAKLKILRASDKKALQGVWEATGLGKLEGLGMLEVVRCNVTFDSETSKSFLLKRMHDDETALGDWRTSIGPHAKPMQLHWKRADDTSNQSNAIVWARCAHDRTSQVQQSDALLDRQPQKRQRREKIAAVGSSSFVESRPQSHTAVINRTICGDVQAGTTKDERCHHCGRRDKEESETCSNCGHLICFDCGVNYVDPSSDTRGRVCHGCGVMLCDPCAKGGRV